MKIINKIGNLFSRKITAAILAGVMSMSTVAVTQAATRSELAAIQADKSGNLQYWTRDSVAAKTLTDYVKDVTNPKSKNYIPPEDRIAVFDLDGTLICETTPSYFEWMLYLERALNDKSYHPTAEAKAYAEEVQKTIREVGIPNQRPDASRKMPGDMDKREAIAQAAVFAGMTLTEYEAFVQKFMETPAEGMENLKRGESFYVPMVEVVAYLNANGFKNFIVSGTDRQTLRILSKGVLPIEPENIIGTDVWYLADHQGTIDGLDYVYGKNDKLIRGEFTLKNVKMNKVSNIAREIGKQPVLAFGNSSGDASMLNYCIAGNKYKALSFGVLCDDIRRELGSLPKAESMRKSCEKNGWVPISMKNDFKTIYGDGVKPSQIAK